MSTVMESTKHTELSDKGGDAVHSDPQTTPVTPEAMRHGYEASGINTRALLICVIVLVVTAIVIHVALWFLQSGLLFADRGSDVPTSGVTHIPPAQTAPPLQPSPEHDTKDRQDLQIMYAGENEVFSRLGWIKPGEAQTRVPDAIVDAIAKRSAAPASSAPATNPPVTNPPATNPSARSIP